MSIILRRPMFRGGSTGQGITSVPRKGYANSDEDGVQSDDDKLLESGTITNPVRYGIENIDPKIIKREASDIQNKRKTYKAFGQNIEEGSYGDIIMKEYLGNRPDPLGKFLINFGLNYMSARPRGGKFGALATAADAAKKPTEQLYADIDTDRALKLKLMTAISKGESKVALEKEARLLVEQGFYKDMKTALGALMKARLEQKASTNEARITEQQKLFGETNPNVGRKKAEIEIESLPKLKNVNGVNEYDNLALTNRYINQGALVRIPNSTDKRLENPPVGIDKLYKPGLIYIDIGTRDAFKYQGNNLFRLVKSLG